MIKDHNIICISSIDWDFVWQGHQEIMAAFARNGNRVLFIENTGIRAPTFKDIPRLRKRFQNWFKSIKGFREEMDNLFVYSPIIFPFPYSKIANWINKYMLLFPLRRWMKTVDFHNPIIWTFLPTRTALNIINHIDRKLLIYYCIADFYKLSGSPKKVRKTENELIKKSDLIFVQGKVLEEKCKRFNDNVYIYPFGVNIEIFENFQYSPDNVPNDIKNVKKPIIGYIGGIHRHIDFQLIKYVAKNYPNWSIVLIGPVQTDISEINNLENVFLLGKKDFSKLPHYINQFDVGIVPYTRSGYTETVFPTKLNEYHAMGKPVVSTELPEVSTFNEENNNLVLISKTKKEFADCISNVLKRQNNEKVNERMASARKNSWSLRIGEMSHHTEIALAKKAKSPIDWQVRFIKFYKVTRRRIIKLGAIALAIYLLIFYTPLVWFLASPLKISQPPEKADCIVVFAGGVGESGKAGQGYEERVQYGVELYKKGFAKHLIFSSGYMYIFKEPVVMEALAVSLGVPKNAIILEDKASSTYENVKFTRNILSEKGWDEILLVSSPYHMRRVFLVAKKITPEINIIYTPVPNGRFYKHGINTFGKKVWKQVGVQQIRALIHEYLAIIYYWYKQYI